MKTNYFSFIMYAANQRMTIFVYPETKIPKAKYIVLAADIIYTKDPETEIVERILGTHKAIWF